MRAAMAIFYFAAGVLHLTQPDKFLLITPDWIPAPRVLILATGVCEVLGAIALMTPRLRKFAGLMLALYAVCVFPANLKHAFEAIDVPGVPSSWAYHAPRLALQPVLVWWALFCSGWTRWPFGGGQPPSALAAPRAKRL